METFLINDYSSTTFEQVDDKVIIKGFASTSTVDREKEIVEDPREFDVVSFKNSPQLLVDHKYIKDTDGNEVSAGKVVKAIPSYIQSEDSNNPKNWVVASLQDGKFVSLWPKEKSVDLKEGDAGLFVVAEVTQEKAKKWVLDGELGTLSWKGFAVHEEKGDITALKGIDLLEISMTRIQANRPSSFTVVNEDDPTYNLNVDFTDCKLSALKFNKKNYSIENINSYTKSINIDKCTISENDECYFVSFGDSKVDTSKNFVFCTEKGLSLIAAPKLEQEVVPLVGEIKSKLLMEKEMSDDVMQDVLLVSDLSQFKNLQGIELKEITETELNGKPVRLHGAVVVEKSVEAPVQEDTEAKVDEVEAPVAETPAEDKPVVEETQEEVAPEVPASEKVEKSADSGELDKLISTVEKIAQAVNDLTVKQASFEKSLEEKTSQIEKSVSDKLENYEKKEQVQEKFKNLDNIVNSFGLLTPEDKPRKEKVQSEKSLSEDTVDSDIDSLFT